MLSARKEVRAAENKPAWTTVHEPGVNDEGDLKTHENEDAVHIIFE